jgi:hypothetical protein
MASIWMSVSGGWDHIIDDVPMPKVVDDIDREIDGLFEELVEVLPCFDWMDFSCNLPEELLEELREIIGEADESEGTLFEKSGKEAQEWARTLFKKHVTKLGYEYIHQLSDNEGSFYRLSRVQVP